MHIQEVQSYKGATCPLDNKEEPWISPGRKGMTLQQPNHHLVPTDGIEDGFHCSHHSV